MNWSIFILGGLFSVGLLLSCIGIYVLLHKRDDLKRMLLGSSLDLKREEKKPKENTPAKDLPFDILGPTRTKMSDFVEDEFSTDDRDIAIEEEPVDLGDEDDHRGISRKMVERGASSDSNDDAIDHFVEDYLEKLTGGLEDLPEGIFSSEKKISEIISYVESHVPKSRDSLLSEESKEELKLFNIIK